MDFIYSTTNLRARNFKLDEVDRIKIQTTSNLIVPALTTTTAAVVGIQGILLLKYLQKKPREDMRRIFLRLHLAEMTYLDPEPTIYQVDEELDAVLAFPKSMIFFKK